MYHVYQNKIHKHNGINHKIRFILLIQVVFLSCALYRFMFHQECLINVNACLLESHTSSHILKCQHLICTLHCHHSERSTLICTLHCQHSEMPTFFFLFFKYLDSVVYLNERNRISAIVKH